MKAKDVYKIVSSRIQDLMPNRRWQWENPADDNTPSLQDFLNNALLNVVLHRPDSNPYIKSHTLTKGPMQMLEEDDLTLLECIRNIKPGGKYGRAVTRIDRSEMDSFFVDWYEDDENFEFDGVWNWAYERLTNPLVFWVNPWPLQDGTGNRLEMVVSRKPALITSPDDDITISPLFKSALESWMLFEIMASDTSESNWKKALQYFQSFGQVLGVKMKVDMGYPIKISQNEGAKNGD